MSLFLCLSLPLFNFLVPSSFPHICVFFQLFHRQLLHRSPPSQWILQQSSMHLKGILSLCPALSLPPVCRPVRWLLTGLIGPRLEGHHRQWVCVHENYNKAALFPAADKRSVFQLMPQLMSINFSSKENVGKTIFAFLLNLTYYTLHYTLKECGRDQRDWHCIAPARSLHSAVNLLVTLFKYELFEYLVALFAFLASKTPFWFLILYVP